MEDREFYVFDPVHLVVKDLESDGLILDIGGGGEVQSMGNAGEGRIVQEIVRKAVQGSVVM